jgi:hypothetical protein
MRRGAISKGRIRLKHHISTAIQGQGIPGTLAQRIAFQLVFKFTDGELNDREVWMALGQLLRQEVSRLRHHAGLADRQIIAVLPKLSARQVEDFIEELRATDPTIARTILNAALEAAEPLTAGRRYLAEYCEVVRQLQAIDPTVARTLANATFTACSPRTKATELLERFATLMRTFGNEVAFARLVSKATFRARDPLKAAEEFIHDYTTVFADLVSHGIATNAARTVAGLSRFRRDVRKTDGQG